MSTLLQPGQLTWSDIKDALRSVTKVALVPECFGAIERSAETVSKIVRQSQAVYGINTGFGALAKTRIAASELLQLQRNIVLSHAAGVGELLTDPVVRLILLLKINSLSRGYSGVRLEVIEGLLCLLNHQLLPCIPAQGSVGASGDLAPLAHMSLALLGEGDVRCQGEKMSAADALRRTGLSPLELQPKEGLALLNGTQASTAIALAAAVRIQHLLQSALITGAMSTDAAKGSVKPFTKLISEARGHAAQSAVASCLRELLQGSSIVESHSSCHQVQDPYSLRCQPQVMGACLMQWQYARDVLVTEANAVSDNPLVFADTDEIISGGNFHAEPVAFAADALAVVIAEIGALAERRIALLMDNRFSGLPMFLVQKSGVNSGFMMAQVSAAALASENKLLAHPASVDSIPTSANQEDHVSMATHAAYRLHRMCDNVEAILAIELLCAAQGIDLLAPLTTSSALQARKSLLRQHVPMLVEDRLLSLDIEKARKVMTSPEWVADCSRWFD